jgi:putative transposase
MPKKRHKAEEIVAKLRQVEVLTAQGKPVAEAIRSIGVTEVTYYRWRNEYGGLKGDQVKRLKELEAENTRLRRAVSDLTLEKLILKEAASGNFFSIRASLVNSLCARPRREGERSCGALASLRDRRPGRLMMGSEGVGGAI